MVEKYTLVWTKASQQQIKQAYEHIRKDSLQNAEKVVTDIVVALNKALNNPEIYGRDKYKVDNDGTYRSFEKHHFRISYRFTGNIIRVLRVRHTSREPKEY